jgi:hypothetical protein
MARASDLAPAANANTAELEAITVLRQIREHGGYVLLDLQGCIHVRHVACVPPEFRSRLERYYLEIARILLRSVQ